jgi:hypothetical protein
VLDFISKRLTLSVGDFVVATTSNPLKNKPIWYFCIKWLCDIFCVILLTTNVL